MGARAIGAGGKLLRKTGAAGTTEGVDGVGVNPVTPRGTEGALGSDKPLKKERSRYLREGQKLSM